MTRKSRRNSPERLELRKCDPAAGWRVPFR
ncbi:50S ribosomal protein L33 [Streptomyces finlayi]